MQSVKGFSESPTAITWAATSLAFFTLKRTAVYRSVSIPMNKNMKLSKNTLLKASQTQCRASLEVQDSSARGTDSQVHGLSETVVGILGGGQLGRMLCEAASQMAIKVIILDPMENCPASNLCHYHMVGSYDDSATIEEFAKRCGVLTVEIEHADAATLEKLEQQGVDCQPKASMIRIIQIDNLEGAKRAADLFGYPLMIKSKRLAYDGRGNAVARNEDEISLAVNALGGYARGLYVEKWAPFVKEWSPCTIPPIPVSFMTTI